jgi:CHAD domain-containing protein
VRREWKRVRNGVRDAPAYDDHAMHQVRKDAKRLRYAAETLAPVWGKDAQRLAKAAKRLTQHLGERQDTVVTREHLVRLAAVAAGEGEASFTWGRLHAREQRHAEELDARWDDVWQRASRKKLRRWLG